MSARGVCGGGSERPLHPILVLTLTSNYFVQRTTSLSQFDVRAVFFAFTSSAALTFSRF